MGLNKVFFTNIQDTHVMDAKKPLQHPEEDGKIKVIVIKESYLVLKHSST